MNVWPFGSKRVVYEVYKHHIPPVFQHTSCTMDNERDSDPDDLPELVSDEEPVDIPGVVLVDVPYPYADAVAAEAALYDSMQTNVGAHRRAALASYAWSAAAVGGAVSKLTSPRTDDIPYLFFLSGHTHTEMDVLAPDVRENSPPDADPDEHGHCQ